MTDASTKMRKNKDNKLLYEYSFEATYWGHMNDGVQLQEVTVATTIKDVEKLDDRYIDSYASDLSAAMPNELNFVFPLTKKMEYKYLRVWVQKKDANGKLISRKNWYNR